MSQFKFLTTEDVLLMHTKLTAPYNTTSDVRDIKLLESALAQPQFTLFGEYAHANIFEMAAAYCYHLIKNHPFVDSNKRVGILSAITFLEKNGYKVGADPDELYLLAVHTAASKISKEDIAEFFRKIAQ